ncbi:FAD-dependent monooxygenase [Streptomyces europaeiscabiei]|uniref:FAD-dependent monooxygenase n=1 Tax=Streptomyces europaeiscabiei TaxID=146819 RepID=UPI002E195128
MRVRDDLAARLTIDADRSPGRGPANARSATPCAVTATSRCATGALLLAGDATHIVPPGAKGLDHAVSDVRVQARAFIEPNGNGTARKGSGTTPRPLLGVVPRPGPAADPLLIRHDRDAAHPGRRACLRPPSPARPAAPVRGVPAGSRRTGRRYTGLPSAR